MKRPTKIFKAQCSYGNYDVTALGFTEKQAKDAVLESLEGHVKECGHDSAQAFWNYVGGSVHEMTPGEAEWL